MMYNPYAGMPQAPMNQFGQMPYNPYPMQNAPTGITVAQVPTIDDVEKVQMMPNERKIVLVQNDPNLFAIRVADNAGWAKTEYRTSAVIDPKTMTQQPQYAPVQAVLELKNEIEEIKKTLGGGMNAKSASVDAAG